MIDNELPCEDYFDPNVERVGEFVVTYDLPDFTLPEVIEAAKKQMDNLRQGSVRIDRRPFCEYCDNKKYWKPLDRVHRHHGICYNCYQLGLDLKENQNGR